MNLSLAASSPSFSLRKNHQAGNRRSANLPGFKNLEGLTGYAIQMALLEQFLFVLFVTFVEDAFFTLRSRYVRY